MSTERAIANKIAEAKLLTPTLGMLPSVFRATRLDGSSHVGVNFQPKGTLDMNRYQIENAAFKVKGYYIPPCVSDHKKNTVQERFEEAKAITLRHMLQAMKDVEDLTFEQCFPKARPNEAVNNLADE